MLCHRQMQRSSGHITCVTHCREKAKGATFFEATEGETVKPMLDVSWAPMLGAFSVLFEANSEGRLKPLRSSVSIAAFAFII